MESQNALLAECTTPVAGLLVLRVRQGAVHTLGGGAALGPAAQAVGHHLPLHRPARLHLFQAPPRAQHPKVSRALDTPVDDWQGISDCGKFSAETMQHPPL